jgi:hypothetical protein
MLLPGGEHRVNLLKERPEQQMIVIVEDDIGNATADATNRVLSTYQQLQR